jgi:hypothetical protein
LLQFLEATAGRAGEHSHRAKTSDSGNHVINANGASAEVAAFSADQVPIPQELSIKTPFEDCGFEIFVTPNQR